MNLGSMRYQLHFYKPKQITNKLGDVRTCYFYAFSLWASINELGSDESINAGAQNATITAVFKTRFALFDTSYKVLFNANKEPINKLKSVLLSPSDKVYELTSICDKTGLQKELEIKATLSEKRGDDE